MNTPTLAPVAVCLMFAGCDGYNPAKVRGAVAQDHPSAEIAPLPGSQFKFLVRHSDGRVIYIEYMGIGLNPTASAVLFNAR